MYRNPGTNPRKKSHHQNNISGATKAIRALPRASCQGNGARNKWTAPTSSDIPNPWAVWRSVCTSTPEPPSDALLLKLFTYSTSNFANCASLPASKPDVTREAVMMNSPSVPANLAGKEPTPRPSTRKDDATTTDASAR